MSFAPDIPNSKTANPAELMRFPVGAVSPLWGLFAGAAMTGATWWWMTRWSRPQNLEALLASAPAAEAPVETVETVQAEAQVLLAPIEAPVAPEVVPAPAQAAIEAAPETIEAANESDIAEPAVAEPVAALAASEGAIDAQVVEAPEPETQPLALKPEPELEAVSAEAATPEPEAAPQKARAASGKRKAKTHKAD